MLREKGYDEFVKKSRSKHPTYYCVEDKNDVYRYDKALRKKVLVRLGALNMLKKYISLICLIFSVITTSLAQTALHQWTTHAPGMKVINVEKVNEKIFAATPYEIFYYNTGDNSINKLSKVNGLSDFGVSVMRYNKNVGLVFVGYTNANIDLIDKDGNVINIGDIKNKNILADKTIKQ